MTAAAAAGGPVAVVGAGLIGTSIALALRDVGRRVLLADRDPARVALAADLGAGERWDGVEPVDHAVLAVPPAAVAGELVALQRKELAATYSDVASVKVAPQCQAAAAGADLASYCGGHPIAGRERGGPAAARADLFLGRPWVLTPEPVTGTAARDAAAAVAQACGAIVVEMSPAEHDRALGLVSHVPQLVASLLAARLLAAPESAVSLAGPGFRDTTRIAASDPALWGEVIAANPGPVLAVLEDFAADLDVLLAALRPASGGAPATGDVPGAGPVGRVPTAVADAVRRGNEGRSRLPGKHGVRAAGYATVPVVVEDAPGRLARLFADAEVAGVNIEDIGIEHAPGRPVGVVELAVRPDGVPRLLAVLSARGWAVHAPAP